MAAVKEIDEKKQDSIGRIYRRILVDGIKDGIEDSNSTFILNYTAVSASEMNDLRKQLKDAGAKVYIAKNRLARVAFREIEKEHLSDCVKGQTAFVWSDEDSVSITKILVDFSKKIEGLVVRGGLLGDDFLTKDDIKRLSDLPNKETLQAQLLQTMLAPLTRFAGALNSKTRDLLSILKQLSEKKEEG